MAHYLAGVDVGSLHVDRAGLGLKLLLRGRLSLRTERMRGDREQLHRLLDAVDQKHATLTTR